MNMEWRHPANSTNARLREMVEIARSLIEGPLEERLSAAVQHAPRALALASASIFLVRDDFAGFGDRLSLPGIVLIDVRPREAGMTARVAHTGQTLVVEDASSYPGVNPLVVQAGIGAFLAVPLNSSGGCLGVMYLNQPRPRTFSRDDVELAEAIGNMVGQAVENARLQEREKAAREALEAERAHLASLTAALNRALEEAELLKDAGQEASTAMNLQELLERLVGQLRKAMPAGGASILLLEGEHLTVAATTGLAERRAGQRVRRGQQQVWRALGSGEPLLEGVRRGRGASGLLAPLRWRDEVFGLLEVNAEPPSTFDVPDMNLARKVADQVAGWINTLRR
jgi:GAF domain-containing protein